jgi:hypothetical protein
MASKSVIKFKEIASRLSGISFSLPSGIGGGISWQPSKTERVVAKSVVNFLEDKRVLYNPTELEIPQHCVMSIIDIRRFLTSKIDELDDQSQLMPLIKTMRSACREFQDSVEKRGTNLRFHFHNSDSWEFSIALGEMRRTFGYCLSQMISMFELDVENDLASIIPVGYND